MQFQQHDTHKPDCRNVTDCWGLQQSSSEVTRQILCVDKKTVKIKRCYHLKFMVVDIHIYCLCANSKCGCSAPLENSQHGIRESSQWEFLPVFEKRKGVFKGGKQLEGKSEFRNRSPCSIR